LAAGRPKKLFLEGTNTTLLRSKEQDKRVGRMSTAEVGRPAGMIPEKKVRKKGQTDQGKEKQKGPGT